MEKLKSMTRPDVCSFTVVRSLWPDLSSRKTLIASLILVLMMVPAATRAQSYEEKAVAAVLMAEAWNQGSKGMLGVGEVIATRARDNRQTPWGVVTMEGAFSCLRRRSIDQWIRHFQTTKDWPSVVAIAQRVVQKPGSLPGMTKGANHFTRKEEKPYWARGRRPVFILKDHAFYKLPT